MPRNLLSIAALLTLLPGVCLSSAAASDLTFEDRVQAQEAIERIYYSHQVGRTKPFEEAVPRSVLEAKVRKYLKQSVALGEFWHAPVTAEMLERELQRMSRGTRLPDRLQELFTALDNDPVLIQECLARATLVDRLTRSLFAFDARSHEAARDEIDAVHQALVKRTLDPRQKHPRRTEVEWIRESDEGPFRRGQKLNEIRPDVDTPKGPDQLAMSPERFNSWRSRLPEVSGKIGPVVEDRESFQVHVLLEEDDTRVRVASYRVEKTPWDTWWKTVSPELNEATVVTTASSDLSVLEEGGASSGQWDPSLRDPCAGDDTWDSGMLAAFLEPRSAHTAVWTGNLMLAWGGGEPGVSSLNTGGRYDPTTDSWTAISVTGAPSNRSRHTAVWTGSRMLIWGGIDENGILFDTGGRYDPISDTWAPISMAEAPSARYRHTAVWTGNLMLIWGGWNDNHLDTGGRYDPETDSWKKISTAGAPPPVGRHTAVWTGSRMLVWGGGDTDFTNAGGQYDPASDSWTTMSTTNAPAGRVFHTAVWTGSRMLVWGGQGSPTAYYATGGQYDPVADLWTATSMVDAPSDRRLHSAVWTGSLLLIWGGQGYLDVDQNTGGRYDPTTDSWTATSTAGAPSPRHSHTAVWTGSLMLIWGGYDGYEGLNLDAGGRYALGHSSDDDEDGYSECVGDCDDDNPDVYPGAEEVCNAVDDNCDGAVDEDCPFGDVVLSTVPQPLHFYPRDRTTDTCTFTIEGETLGVASAVRVVVTQDDASFVEATSGDALFAVPVTIDAGLHLYDVAVAWDDGSGWWRPVAAVENVVCGDVFLIEGQSNAVARDYHDEHLGDLERSTFVRSFGSSVKNATTVEDKRFGVAVADEGYTHAAIGQWGMRLARTLKDTQQLPILVINGASGGTPIALHLRNEVEPENLNTIYGRLLWRARRAGVADTVRAIFWHQGEADGNLAYANYLARWTTMYDAWLEDFPNVEGVYPFQVRSGCPLGPTWNRNVHRDLPDLLPRVIGHMSTTGVDGHDGCHFFHAAYMEWGDRMARLVNRDLYGTPQPGNIEAPDPESAAWLEPTELAIEFGATGGGLFLQPGAVDWFSLSDGVAVTDALVEGTSVVLTTAAPSAATWVSFVEASGDVPWLVNDLGIGSFAWFQLPTPSGTPLLVVDKSDGDALITWDPPAYATEYDIVVGDLSTLRNTGGNFGDADCLDENRTTTWALFSPTPLSGQGFWFLVRSADSGAVGTYNSGGAGQVASRDPDLIPPPGGPCTDCCQ